MAGSGRAAGAWGRGAMTVREVLAGMLDVGPWEVAVGALVGMSVLLVAGPRGRSVPGVAGRRWGRGAEGSRAAGGAGGGALGRRLGWWPGLPWGAGTSDAPSVQVVVTQVAGMLRAGMAPGQAWQSVGQVRVDPRGIPDADDLVALVVAGSGPVRGTVTAAARRQVAAIVAACRLAAETGAPLAAVLDVIVGTLVTAARGEQERAAALAGPRSTARVLAWLPGIGAVVGMALGADPLGLVTAGGLGATAPVVGLVLVGVGHRWTTRLVARARAAGDPP